MRINRKMYIYIYILYKAVKLCSHLTSIYVENNSNIYINTYSMIVLYTLGMKSPGSGVANVSRMLPGPSSGWRVMIRQQINL